MEEPIGKCAYCEGPVTPSSLVRAMGSVFCSAECAKAMEAKAQKLHKELRNARSYGLIPRLIGALFFIAVVLIVLELFNIIDFLPFI